MKESGRVILLDVRRVTRTPSTSAQPWVPEQPSAAENASTTGFDADVSRETELPLVAADEPARLADGLAQGTPVVVADESARVADVSRETEHPVTVSSESAWLADGLAQLAPAAVAEESARVADVSRETTQLPADETPIATQTATAMRVLGHSGETFPRPARRRIVTVANQKGGVGKTTTTVNIAAAMALHGLRVLVVDLDPQGNASTALGIDHHADIPSVYDLLIEGKSLADVMVEVSEIPGLACVPATIDLAGAEIELVSLVAREARLRRALVEVAGDFDYVLIDCPPSLGLLTVNALVAGEEVLIPIQCEYYALEGLGQLLSNIELVKSHLNPDLRVSTILLTMYDARTRLASQVADDVRSHFGTTVLRTVIPRSVRVSEAPSYGQTVMTYDPASPGALCYLDAAREIAERGAADGKTLHSGPAQGDSR